MFKYVNLVVEKLVNVLICVIFIAILFCLYNLFCLKVLKNDYVNVFGYSIFEVATGSMGESIEVADAVVVKIDEEYAVGDVVTYQNGKDFITHRVIKDEGDYIITKGDANNTSDNPIDKGLVLGKVVHVFKGVGVWKDVLLTPKVLVLIFLTLFMFSLLFSYNGKKIKIVMLNDQESNGDNAINNDLLEDELDRRRRLRKEHKPPKKLEYTQVFAVEKKETLKKEVKPSKKKLEYTQIIDPEEVKNYRKKTLDYTQIIDLKDIKSGDKHV